MGKRRDWLLWSVAAVWCVGFATFVSGWAGLVVATQALAMLCVVAWVNEMGKDCAKEGMTCDAGS